MENQPPPQSPPTFNDAVDRLRDNDWFRIIIMELVTRRETTIKDMADYTTDVELRKQAAKITVFTELLDDFEGPSAGT